jgi:Zn-dependent alcohol dehydrogenase
LALVTAVGFAEPEAAPDLAAAGVGDELELPEAVLEVTTVLTGVEAVVNALEASADRT